MRIRYFATIREFTREQERDWTTPAATVRELLATLATRYGERFRAAVLDKGELSPIVIVLVNGQDVRHQRGIDTPLRPDDTISIFPMVAGG